MNGEQATSNVPYQHNYWAGCPRESYTTQATLTPFPQSRTDAVKFIRFVDTVGSIVILPVDNIGVISQEDGVTKLHTKSDPNDHYELGFTADEVFAAIESVLNVGRIAWVVRAEQIAQEQS